MRRENEIESLIKSRGEVAVTLNAISLFHNPHYPSATSPTETSTPASISPGILTPMATIESDDAEDLSVDPPAAGQGVFETFVDRVSRVEMIQAAVKHVWETKITPQTDLSLTGVVSSNNGSGNGNLTTTIRHVLSPELWGEVSRKIWKGIFMMNSLSLN